MVVVDGAVVVEVVVEVVDEILFRFPSCVDVYELMWPSSSTAAFFVAFALL